METNTYKKLAKYSDEFLIELYRSGFDRAFDALLVKNREQIKLYVSKTVINQEDAEDLYQEISCLLAERIKNTYQERGQFQSWLYRVVNNYVISYHRKGKHLFSKVDLEKYSCAELASAYSLSAESREHKFEELRKSVKILPDDLKHLVEMRIWQGLSLQAIADRLDMKKSTVAERLRIAYRKLEKEMLSKGYTDAII